MLGVAQHSIYVEVSEFVSRIGCFDPKIPAAWLQSLESCRACQYKRLTKSKKKIEIRTYYHTYLNCGKCIWDLVESMLSKLMCLEEFDFRIIGEHYNAQEEIKLSKLLYSCPMVSTTCEVRFVGRILHVGKQGQICKTITN